VPRAKGFDDEVCLRGMIGLLGMLAKSSRLELAWL
jgi:hypothetical protein